MGRQLRRTRLRDDVDIFRAPDCDTAAKISAIVRSYGHGHTEIRAAAEWEHFKHVIRVPSAAEAGGASSRVIEAASPRRMSAALPGTNAARCGSSEPTIEDHFRADTASYHFS